MGGPFYYIYQKNYKLKVIEEELSIH